MKNFLAKAGMLAASFAAPVLAFAEGEPVAKELPADLSADIFLAYKDSITDVFVNVLIGFAVVVVSFFAWRLMKKALNGAK